MKKAKSSNIPLAITQSNLGLDSFGLTPRDIGASGLYSEEHVFKDEFVVTGKCKACGQIFLGTTHKCEKCGLLVHKRCKDVFYVKCTGVEEPIDFPKPTFGRKDLKNGQHSFRKVTNPLTYSCSICHEKIVVDRYKCSICNMNVHKKCVKNI